MRSSATSNHETTGSMMLFRNAVIAVERALRRRWGNRTEIPLLSHALSHIDDNGCWHVADISGNVIAIVTGNRAELIEVESET